MIDSQGFLKWIKSGEENGNQIDLAGSAVQLPDHLLAALLNCDEFRRFQCGSGNSRFSVPNPWGHPALKYALAHQSSVEAENIMITGGASLAMFEVLHGLLDRGDDVLVEDPTYEPFLETPKRAAGANVHRFRRGSKAHDKPDYAALVSQLRSVPRPRAIIFSNPANPTGAFWDESSLTPLAEIAEEFQVTVVVDEIFRDLAPPFDRFPKPPTHISKRFVSVSGLSKSYGLDWLRCGWIISAQPLTERIREAHVAIENIGSSLTQAFSSIVLEDRDKHRRLALARLRENRVLAESHLRPLFDEGLLEGEIAEFSSVTFPRIPSMSDTSDFAKSLSDRHGVRISPGKFFGAPQHVRIGFGGLKDKVDTGLAIFSEQLRFFYRASRNHGERGNRNDLESKAANDN